MTGKITKTEKILVGCTAVFVLCLCAVCFGEIAAGRNGSSTVEPRRTVSEEMLIPERARRVNINTADAELLTELPGIGPTLAARIVEYREQHGPFPTTAHLMKVEGIGPGIYMELMKLVTAEVDTR